MTDRPYVHGMLHQPLSPDQPPTAIVPSPVPGTPAPHDERLGLHGAILQSLLARPARIPERWRAPGFARQVDLVRSHLRPLGNHGLLAQSYGREHFNGRPSHLAPPDPAGLLRRSATEVAYAMRWLELAGQQDHVPWPVIIGDR